MAIQPGARRRQLAVLAGALAAVLPLVMLVLPAATATAAIATAATTPAASPASTRRALPPAGVSRSECAANRAAGPITFETGYDYAAAASILDVVVAKDKGWFHDLCLDIVLEPGFDVDNVATVSADKVQISSLGSDSEVIAAVRQGADLVGIATYGDTAISELITPGDTHYTSLRQLDGQAIGIKGALPYEVAAMLVKSGVDIASLRQVQESYNPVVIDQGAIKALPVYKSNEIYELDQLHLGYHVWNPTNYHVAASFAALVANRTWAAAHPSAVEDFLRADIHAFTWAATHQDAAVADTQARLNPALGISLAQSRFRWKVESALCLRYTPGGVPFGETDLATTTREYAQDRALHLVAGGVKLTRAFDNRYLEHDYRGTKLIWPPGLG